MEKVLKITIITILAFFIFFASVARCYIISDEQMNHQIISLRDLDIEQILQKARIITRSEDALSTEKSTLAYTAKISISRAKSVEVEIDGKTTIFYTTSETVQDFLDEKGIKLTDKDYLNPAFDSPIENQKITIKTYIEKEKIINVPFDFKVVYSNDNRVAKGLIVKLNSGKDGTLTKHFKEIYFGGKKIKEEFLYNKVTKAPIDEIYLVGSAKPPEQYLKLYNMVATAYSPTISETDSDPWTTASGLKSGFGVVAVDPKLIPLGSLLYVEDYGYAVAGDTGGAIKGERLDVFFYAPKQSNKWGVKNVKVYLLPGKWKFNEALKY